MKFRLEINVENDVFCGGVCERDAEVARILREVADKLVRTNADAHTMHDSNGNLVGIAEFVE